MESRGFKYDRPMALHRARKVNRIIFGIQMSLTSRIGETYTPSESFEEAKFQMFGIFRFSVDRVSAGISLGNVQALETLPPFTNSIFRALKLLGADVLVGECRNKNEGYCQTLCDNKHYSEKIVSELHQKFDETR